MGKNIACFFKILFIAFICVSLVTSAPVPDSYTEQGTPIDLNVTNRPTIIAYTPDQNSMAYVSGNTTEFTFRSSLMQSQQKRVSVFKKIYAMSFDGKGQRLYVAVIQATTVYGIDVYYFSVSNGQIDNTNFTLCSFRTYYDASGAPAARLAVSPFQDKIAVSLGTGSYGQLVILRLTEDKSTAIIDASLNISNSVNDIHWHPTERQTLLYGTVNNLQFLKFNCTSKQASTLSNTGGWGVGAMLSDGSVFVETSSNFQTNFYTYSGTTNLSLIFQISGFNISSQSISLDRRIAVATNNNSEVLIYELVPPPAISEHEEGNIQARPQFKLIFNQSAAAQLKFAGISADGNQVYFYKGTAKTFTRFSRCGDGKYQSNGQCYNCSSTCKTCHISATQCTTCPPTSLYLFDSCVTCTAKYPGCESCSQTDCIKCNATANFNITPFNNKCYCSDQAFPINEGKQCKYCKDVILGCKICQNSFNCTECDTDGHFVLNPESKICTCVEPYYLKNNQSCQSCDNDIKGCTSCAMVGGQLLCQSCDYGFSLSADKKSCIDCYKISAGCVNCGDTTTCLQCDTTNNFVKNGTKCQCIQNYVPSLTKCVSCTSLFGCLTCSDIYTCTKCVSGTGLILQNGKCKCGNGSAFDGNSCVPCSQITGCLSCSNGQNCTQCDDSNNFELSNNGKCQCKSKFYLNKNVCETCSVKFPFCATCSSDGTQCLSCEYAQQKLNENKSACVCDDYKYLDQNKNCQFCDPYQKCLSCQNVNSCTKCDTQKYYNATPIAGVCQCQSGYVQQNNACVVCNVRGCSQCPSFNNCTKCQTDKKFSVDPVNNVCVCRPYTYLSDDKTECLTCNQKMYGCISCTSLSLCTGCDSSKNLRVNSTQNGCTCMDNNFLRDGECLKCTAFVPYCSSCYEQRSQVKCDKCNAGFEYNLATNKCVCPEGSEIDSNYECKIKQDGLQAWQVILALLGVLLLNVLMSYLLIKFCKKSTSGVENIPSYQQTHGDYYNDNNNNNDFIYSNNNSNQQSGDNPNYNYNRLVNNTEYQSQNNNYSQNQQ